MKLFFPPVALVTTDHSDVMQVHVCMYVCGCACIKGFVQSTFAQIYIFLYGWTVSYGLFLWVLRKPSNVYKLNDR